MAKVFSPHGATDFSIIITCYNKRNTIMRAIDSALQQTANGMNIEIVVVDDQSTDGSQHILSQINNPAVNVILTEKNQGALKAYLLGFSHAKGKFLVMLDGDDLLAPGILNALNEARLLNNEDTCLRLMMSNLETISPDFRAEQPKIKHKFAPAYWFTVMQNTGGTAYIFPRALLASLELKWPEITVQDHILPGILALHAQQFLKLGSTGYFVDTKADVNSLGKQSTRIHRDRLISDDFLLEQARRMPLPRIPVFLLTFGTALRIRKLARTYGVRISNIFSLVFGDPQNLTNARKAILSEISFKPDRPVS